jgi:hypothetical protein
LYSTGALQSNAAGHAKEARRVLEVGEGVKHFSLLWMLDMLVIWAVFVLLHINSAYSS